MSEHVNILMEIKETLGEIKTDLKGLRNEQQTMRDYLRTDVKPVVETFENYKWLGNKIMWLMGFIVLSGSVALALTRF